MALCWFLKFPSRSLLGACSIKPSGAINYGLKKRQDFLLLPQGLIYYKLTDYPYPYQEDNDKFWKPRIRDADISGPDPPQISPKLVGKNPNKGEF